MESPDDSFNMPATIPTNRRTDARLVISRSSIAEIVMGTIMFILGITALAVGYNDFVEPVYSTLGAGIWCGVVVVSAGFVGVNSALRQNQTWNIASMLMACASILFSMIYLVISTASLNAALNHHAAIHGLNTTDTPLSTTTMMTTMTTQNVTDSGAKGNSVASITIVDGIGVLLALASLLTAIIQAISSYQREPFSLPRMIFILGRSLLGCCCRKQLQEQQEGYAREEDFSADVYDQE